jgi:uncharacterized repeat protein (TIGR01451 family)
MKQRNAGKLFTVIAATLLLCGSVVWAGPQMALTVAASKEKIEIVNGTAVKKMQPTATVAAGDLLHYTLTYTNKGNEAATDAVIDNPISSGMSYIDNSATGTGAEITFSIDGGKSYKKPSLLTYEIKLPNGTAQKYTARPEEYTHIRWTLKRVAAGASGTLGFAVRVK